MHKYLKGYITVEASFVVPIILLIYMLIIRSGFYLYNRCVISQNNYLLAFRGSRFTAAEENYGEVIYGDMDNKPFLEEYLAERLIYKIGFYPFAQAEIEKVSKKDEKVTVSVSGFQETLKVSKTAKQINPMENIKRVRRQMDGS